MKSLNQNAKFILMDSLLDSAVFRLENQLIGKDPEAAENVNISNALRSIKAVKDAVNKQIDVNKFLEGDINE